MAMATAMSTEAALYRLLAWLSPAYPGGAYTYSHGLEWAVEAGLVRDRAGLVAWLSTVLRSGGGWQDAVLLAHAHRAVADGDDAGWRELRAMAPAWTPTAELALETRAQGEAFAAASLASWPDPAGRLFGIAAHLAVAPARQVQVSGVFLGGDLALFQGTVQAALRFLELGQRRDGRVKRPLQRLDARGGADNLGFHRLRCIGNSLGPRLEPAGVQFGFDFEAVDLICH